MIDLIVIGAGPGGFDTALHAKKHGLEVVLIEEHKLGGTCLNYGCIPTKALYHNAKNIHSIKESDTFGIQIDNFKLDFKAMKERKESIVASQIKNIAFSLNKAGVIVKEGRASIVDSNTVEVNGEQIRAKYIIIATGSSSSKLSFEGDQLPIVHTSKDILEFDIIPQSMVVVGGGVIGLEMASIFNQFDTKVTLVEYMPEILPLLDKDIRKRAKALIKRKGINILTKTSFKGVKETEDGYLAVVEQKVKEVTIPTDYVLLATGRKPNFGGLNLDALGIKHDKHGINVNHNKQTSVPNIYAIGDVNGENMLAHKATYDGIQAISHILKEETSIDFTKVPAVVFSIPEIASVGVREDELEEGTYRTNKSLFKSNAKAECMNETDGFIKMIVDSNDKIIGVHIIGPHASDLIHEATSLVQYNVHVSKAKDMIHAHPTISEVLAECIKGL
jgi:dihydrolipoamide dehydrogenase